ncbi:MAG: DUF1285 domain-containing protein [Alphaproteobacteria bacterium]|nr:DUF1285 domain-containing protein [Alphaproteobacteria bacterium]
MTAASPQSGLPGPGTLDQNASSHLPFRRSPGSDAHCGDFGIRIARDGTWFYHGSPIGRKPLVRLFSSVLRRDEAGEYWLVTPVEKGRIVVDDAPFTAVELSVTGSGRDAVLTFRTNIDDVVEVGMDRPIRVSEDEATGEPRPYVLVRDRLEALILRPVYYQLVELGQVEPQASGAGEQFGVWSKGVFFPLGRLDGPP